MDQTWLWLSIRTFAFNHGVPNYVVILEAQIPAYEN